MAGYGQVYWATSKGWRATLWKDKKDGNGHEEVGSIVGVAWESRLLPHPDEAFEAMEAKAEMFGITDLRRWSGSIPDDLINDEVANRT